MNRSRLCSRRCSAEFGKGPTLLLKMATLRSAFFQRRLKRNPHGARNALTILNDSKTYSGHRRFHRQPAAAPRCEFITVALDGSVTDAQTNVVKDGRISLTIRPTR